MSFEGVQQEKRPHFLPKPVLSNSSVIRSEDLFGRKRVVLIQHKDHLYRLILTRQGKLVLNK